MNRRNFIRSSTAGLAFVYASLFGLKAKDEENNLSFDILTGRKWDSREEAVQSIRKGGWKEKNPYSNMEIEYYTGDLYSLELSKDNKGTIITDPDNLNIERFGYSRQDCVVMHDMSTGEISYHPHN